MCLFQVYSSIIYTYVHILEKAMAPHSSTLAWRIPGTAEPCGLPSTGSHRVGHDWSDLAAACPYSDSSLIGYYKTEYSPLCYTVGSCWLSILYILVFVCVCACAKLLQLCLTLCDPMDYSLPGSSVHGILQARILEWVAISSRRRSSWPRDWTCISCIYCIGRRVLYH